MLTETPTRQLTYEDDGIQILGRVIDDHLVADTVRHMDEVIDGRYETGVDPVPQGPVDRARLIKIDQPHWADRTIYEAVTSPELGRRVAHVMGAAMVQVWAVQLLYKPPGRGDAAVGWHQDQHYWAQWWEGEVFTSWLALTDVTAEAGPVLFVPGSHRWGVEGGGDFFDPDLTKVKAGLDLPEGATWREEPAILPPGHASLHHKSIIHGSMPNLSDQPRRGFAIHLRTEKSRPLPGGHEDYVGHLDDPARAPVIFGG